MHKKEIKKSGFSLIEVLIVVFIMLVVFTSFYSVSTIGTRYIIESKNRLGATAFANEKMEIARNLKYDDVGIQGGIPSGNLPQDEDVEANGRTFHVHTVVQYIDDAFDGLVSDSAPDVIPNDYKIVKIVISWKDGLGKTQQVSSMSRFVPPGLETSVGGAPFAINVKGSDGIGVKQASVHIVNSAVTPNLNFTLQTDDTGHIMIPAAPASIGGYQITISKDGYETFSTLGLPALDYMGTEFSPTYGNVSVLLGSLNIADYTQDKVSNLTVKTSDYQNNPVGGLAFSISGGKSIGRYADLSRVFNKHDTGTTDATTGVKEFNMISPGNYDISMTPDAKYEFVEFLPNKSPIAMVPGTDLTYEVKVADKDVNGLFLKVIEERVGTAPFIDVPIVNAIISLKDSTNADIFTGVAVSNVGSLFYPNNATPLLSGTYTLKIEAVGYETKEVSIDINKLVDLSVELKKN